MPAARSGMPPAGAAGWRSTWDLCQPFAGVRKSRPANEPGGPDYTGLNCSRAESAVPAVSAGPRPSRGGEGEGGLYWYSTSMSARTLAAPILSASSLTARTSSMLTPPLTASFFAGGAAAGSCSWRWCRCRSPPCRSSGCRRASPSAWPCRRACPTPSSRFPFC